MTNKYALTKLINANGYLCYNKDVARALGVNTAVLLAELINISDMFGGEEFYFEQEKLSYDTALSKYQLQECTKTLVETKILTVTKKGIPCRNYYDINIDVLLEFISSSATRSQETEQQEVEKLDNKLQVGAENEKLDCKKSKNSPTGSQETRPLLKREIQERDTREKHTHTQEETETKTNKINNINNNSERAYSSPPDFYRQTEMPHPSDAVESPPDDDVSGVGKLQSDMFRAIQNHNRTAAPDRRIPVSNNFITFLQVDFRRLFEPLRQEPPEDIYTAIKNYIKVASSRFTWKSFFSMNDFVKNYREYSPQYFSLDKFEDKSRNDKEKDPRYLFIQRMENDPKFDGDLFVEHWDEWLDGERPEGEAYFELQAKWEAEK